MSTGKDDNTLTPSQIQTLRDVNVGLCPLSMAGSAFILLCYLLFPRARKHPSLRLVSYLALADLFAYTGSLLGTHSSRSSVLCQLQAFLSDVFQLSSVLWTTCIAAELLLSAHGRPRSHRDAHRAATHREKLYHSLCWGVPIIMGIAGLAGKLYGPNAGAWCWIENPTIRLTNFYSILWICMLFDFLVYFFIWRLVTVSLSRMQNVSTPYRKSQRQTVRRLFLYPAILVFCWLPASINRINTSASGSQHHNFGLFVAHIVFSRLQGFLNAIVYGLNGIIVRELKEFCCVNKCRLSSLQPSASSHQELDSLPRGSESDLELQTRHTNADFDPGEIPLQGVLPSSGGEGATTMELGDQEIQDLARQAELEFHRPVSLHGLGLKAAAANVVASSPPTRSSPGPSTTTQL